MQVFKILEKRPFPKHMLNMYMLWEVKATDKKF